MSVIRVVGKSLTAPAVGPKAENDDRDTRGFAATSILLAIQAYKIVLSPLVGGSCRFVPSCSDYAVEAVKTHGAAAGAWLAVKRLARCHPLCRAGYDPVPIKEHQGTRAAVVRTR